MDPEKRARKRSARREQLLDAAFEVVRADGLEALTVARLAEHLGQAVGGLYHYFPSKEALLAQMQGRAVGALEAAIQTHLAKVRGASPPSLLALSLVPFRIYLRRWDAASHRLIDSLLSSPGVVFEAGEGRAIEGDVQRVLSTCAELLDDAVGAKELDPGDNVMRANLLWIACHGLDHFKKRDRLVPTAMGSAQTEPAMLSALMVGWGAKHADVERAWAWLDMLGR